MGKSEAGKAVSCGQPLPSLQIPQQFNFGFPAGLIIGRLQDKGKSLQCRMVENAGKSCSTILTLCPDTAFSDLRMTVFMCTEGIAAVV